MCGQFQTACKPSPIRFCSYLGLCHWTRHNLCKVYKNQHRKHYWLFYHLSPFLLNKFHPVDYSLNKTSIRLPNGVVGNQRYNCTITKAVPPPPFSATPVPTTTGTSAPNPKTPNPPTHDACTLHPTLQREPKPNAIVRAFSAPKHTYRSTPYPPYTPLGKPARLYEHATTSKRALQAILRREFSREFRVFFAQKPAISAVFQHFFRKKNGKNKKNDEF